MNSPRPPTSPTPRTQPASTSSAAKTTTPTQPQPPKARTNPSSAGFSLCSLGFFVVLRAGLVPTRTRLIKHPASRFASLRETGTLFLHLYFPGTFFYFSGIYIGPSAVFCVSAVRGACRAHHEFERTPAQHVQVAEQRHRPIETSGETPCAVATVVPFFLLCSSSASRFPVARVAAQRPLPSPLLLFQTVPSAHPIPPR